MTSKYLARFLGVLNKEIKQKVKSGEYALVELNSTPLKDSCLKPLINMAGKAGNLITTY